MKLLLWSTLAFLLLPSVRQVPSQAGAQVWEEYHSREGQFSILLPGKPVNSLEPIGGVSRFSVLYRIAVPSPSGAYSVEYFDIPTAEFGSTSVKKLLDEARDRFMDSGTLTKESEKDIVWKSFQGRELILRGLARTITRILLVKQRVYILSKFFLEQQPPEDTKRFFESFAAIPLTDDEIKSLTSFSPSENERARPKKVRVSGGVLNETALTKVSPTFPNVPSEGGMVSVRIVVSEDGHVIEAEVVSGPLELQEVSLQAAKQWTFKPFVLRGFPVKAEGVLQFNFTRQ
jgi:TonB family protein